MRTELSFDQLTRPSEYGLVKSLVEQWDQLIPGDNLLLLGPKANQRQAGVVDDISEDATILWLILENGGGRKMFHQSDGHRSFLWNQRA